MKEVQLTSIFCYSSPYYHNYIWWTIFQWDWTSKRPLSRNIIHIWNLLQFFRLQNQRILPPWEQTMLQRKGGLPTQLCSISSQNHGCLLALAAKGLPTWQSSLHERKREQCFTLHRLLMCYQHVIYSIVIFKDFLPYFCSDRSSFHNRKCSQIAQDEWSLLSN